MCVCVSLCVYIPSMMSSLPSFQRQRRRRQGQRMPPHWAPIPTTIPMIRRHLQCLESSPSGQPRKTHHRVSTCRPVIFTTMPMIRRHLQCLEASRSGQPRKMASSMPRSQPKRPVEAGCFSPGQTLGTCCYLPVFPCIAPLMHLRLVPL